MTVLLMNLELITLFNVKAINFPASGWQIADAFLKDLVVKFTKVFPEENCGPPRCQRANKEK